LHLNKIEEIKQQVVEVWQSGVQHLSEKMQFPGVL